MTAAEIRAKYPNPTTTIDGKNDSTDRYCVLGAALMYHVQDVPQYRQPIKNRFPLFTHFYGITGIKGGIVSDIMAANTRGDFDRAWQLLDEALKARDSR